MPPPPAPSLAQELLSSGRDEAQSSRLASDASELLLSAAGPSSWARWRAEAEAAARFAYFALHAGAGLQTVGEEYSNLVQVSKCKQQECKGQQKEQQQWKLQF